MKKKSIAVILSVVIVLTFLAACGGTSSNPDDNGRMPPEDEARETSTPEPSENESTPDTIEDIPVVNNQRGNTNRNIADWGVVVKQGDWIFFSDSMTGRNNQSIASTLYKVKTDGSELQELFTGSRVTSLNIIEDWLYFADLSTSGAIYRLKTDGTGLELLHSTDTGRLLIIVVGDWIYLSNGYKIRTDGTNLQNLYDKTGRAAIYTSVEDDWIIFQDFDEDEKSAIFKVKTDGTDLQLLKTGVDFAFVEDGWIYFYDFDNDRDARMKIDGSDIQDFEYDEADSVTIEDGFFVINIGGEVFRVMMD